LEVRLSSRLNITWWKEIKGIDSRRNIVRNPIFTEETNHGPNILTIPVVRTSPRVRPAMPLAISKAKFLGYTKKYIR
jgi:hypothetical protein